MLVSAVIVDGPPRKLLTLATDGEFELIVAEPVLEELRRILADKLGTPVADIEIILALLGQLAPRPAPVPETVEALSGDPDDDRIIAASAAAGAGVLVSGDLRHILPLGTVGDMEILRPQDLIPRLQR